MGEGGRGWEVVMRLLPWRRGISGMSNLIVGVYRGGGVGSLGVREGPLTAGACRMWNRPLLKPLKEKGGLGYDFPNGSFENGK